MKPMTIAIVSAVVIFGALLFWANWSPEPETQVITQEEVAVHQVAPEEPETSEAVNPGLENEVATSNMPQPTPSEPEPEPPELDESDSWIKTRKKEVSTHPFWERVWEQNHLIRKAVVTTDLIARENNPFKQVFFLHPKGQFETKAEGDVKQLSEKNFYRFEGAISAFESLDNQTLVGMYNLLEPLFEQAYAELGNSDRDWRTTLKLAMDNIINTPLPSSPPELLGQGQVYIFKDPSLEALPPAQKALIRMGNINARRIISKVRNLQTALNL